MSENKSSSSKSLIIIIVMLCLTLIGLTGYIVYDKVLGSNANEDNNVSNQNVKIENLDIDSEFVKSLFSKTEYYEHISSRNEYFLKDKLLVSEMSDDLKARIAIANMPENSIQNGEGKKFVEEIPVGEYFSEKNLIDGFSRAFGKNSTYTRLDKIGNSNYEIGYNFYENEEIYYAIPGGSGYVVPFSYDEDIISASKFSNKIEITTTLAYCGISDDLNHSGCYADSEGKILIDSTINQGYDFSGLKYKDKLSQYKYTFTLDNSDGNYYFYSVEKVN